MKMILWRNCFTQRSVVFTFAALFTSLFFWAEPWKFSAGLAIFYFIITSRRYPQTNSKAGAYFFGLLYFVAIGTFVFFHFDSTMMKALGATVIFGLASSIIWLEIALQKASLTSTPNKSDHVR
jgi:hypothetical protein